MDKEYAGNLPAAKTNEIGHGNDSKAIWIGENLDKERNMNGKGSF